MKKQYIKPVQKEFVLLSAPIMLDVSGGEPESNLIGNSNKRREVWSNPWLE